MRASQHSGYCQPEGIEHDEFIQQRPVEWAIALQKARRGMQQLGAPSRATPSSWTSCSRSRSALIRSVTSRLTPTMRTGRPSAPRMVCPTPRMVRMAPSARRTLKSDLYSRSPRSAASTSALARATSSGTRHRDHASKAPLNSSLSNAIEPVHRVVPHQPILLHVPVPDAEPSRIDGELQPVIAHAQTGFAFLELALTTLSRLDFADQIVERRLEPASHVVERLREGSQFLQPAARHPRAQVSASHGLRRARNAPERRGHRRRQCRGQHEGEHQRQGEDHRRTAAADAHARQIERFRHGRDQNPVTASAVLAIRRRVGQPRFPRERPRRDVIEPELRRCCGHARRTRVPRQTCNRTLHHQSRRRERTRRSSRRSRRG